ncbi:hypothetical protein PHMEG_000556 [Phytophthora megakarya]|uniref:Uncharacterized protein n=1 Tax=Phytophthora megakarya TaxID=4795 RepID=A0A225X3D1_9STRA|nr:hypothetical protein PHMEG_000556 [Phytophthora megakarya]
MMLFKYIREPDMLMHVPEVRKMENHKSYLERTVTGGSEINKFETLRNWASLKMCQDHSSFHSVDEDNYAEMNAVIVLDEFKHMTAVGSLQVASMGVVVTAQMFVKQYKIKNKNLVMLTDGTYRIHFGGWTLVDCGGISVETTESGFVQRFRPWLYMFKAYLRMNIYSNLKSNTQQFFNVDVSVSSASIDHSDAIASALV